MQGLPEKEDQAFWQRMGIFLNPTLLLPPDIPLKGTYIS